MKKETIELFIKKEQARSYIRVPFNVPENIEKLVISYSYFGDDADSRQSGQEKNVIDIALADVNGCDVGTRGSSVREITVSAAYATEGYHAVSPVAGEWTLIIGAYQIKPEGVKLKITLCFFEKEFRWLKGDTHLHTNHSDGKFTRDELAKKCLKKGLDYIMFTDHNNDLVGESIPKIKGLTTIKGVELTNYSAHVNFWGKEKPYSGSFAINNREDMLKSMREGIDNGALVCICHPHCTFCGWRFGDLKDVPYQFLEIWNGPMRKDNIKTIEYWDGLLKEGKRIPVVGGSDYHRDYVVTNLLACPTTRLYTDENSETAVLNALKAGRIVITHSPHSTMIDLTIDGLPVGSAVEYRDGLKANVKVAGMKRGHVLRVIDKLGTAFEFKAEQSGDYNFEVPCRGRGYMRADITYKKKGLAKLIYKIALSIMIKKEAKEPMPPYYYALTNAIYID